ncbi:hypothetical protein K461DRAFT_284650 [Myriangium duriaei CBS 260.36]|uniref:U three protein 23 n=1 Tax=Myriangium duriaei CBS 260.36 TaxID=1168546 RepID=A0A9P4JBF5_9PEZI|nr:hypothetical protein K461DRAFT_284650 [Myriangium duriaei CBS 260.36]
MRGKRAKQYRKLMHQYELAFNFREPYQVLVDAEMIQDTTRFKMDLPHLLERTLHGKIKPMITQCSIRHLYLAKHENRDEKSTWINTAKTFERRRCGHHELEQPLSTRECLLSVVDPKDTGSNKHRYIVACQDAELRARMRQIAGVPLVYVQRSVMVMEPMAAKTEEVRNGQEVEKIRSGIKRGRAAPDGGLKRKRDSDESDDDEAADGLLAGQGDGAQPMVKKVKKKGPRGPNPLSVKKAKKRDVRPTPSAGAAEKAKMPDRIERQIRAAKEHLAAQSAGGGDSERAKRKKQSLQSGGAGDGGGATAEVD